MITTGKFNRTVLGETLETHTEKIGQSKSQKRANHSTEIAPRAILESEIEAIFHWAYFDGNVDDKNNPQQ